MNKRNYIVLLLSVLLIWHCSDNSTQSDDAKSHTESGWQEFQNGNYSDALTNFEEAISLDINYVDAYNGAGWANGKLGILTDAINRFNSGLELDSSNVDMLSGIAFVYNASKDYQNSIMKANSALSIKSHWTFSHISTIDYKDLRLLLAENYFAVADFQSSLSEVKILNSSFNADVTTQSGITELSLEIERLKGII